MGAKRELKSTKNHLKSLPGAKTAIFRKSCSRVHGSIDFEVRRSSKTTKNLKIHEEIACMQTERQKVRFLSDLGSILRSKREPKTHQNPWKNHDCEKSAQRSPKAVTQACPAGCAGPGQGVGGSAELANDFQITPCNPCRVRRI